MDQYYNLQSKKQIKVLYDSKYRNDLIYLVTKRLRLNRDDVIEALRKSKGNDILFYRLLQDMFNVTKVNEAKDEAFEYRAKKRLDDMKSIFNNKTFKMYLDIGSDDCLIPNSISEFYGLNKDTAFASDIVDKCKFDKFITFVKLVVDEHSRLYSPEYFEKFDLITAFQSLHHIKDIEFRLEEIQKLSQVGCRFLIREHDAINSYVKMMIDIEHLLYEVFLENRDLEDFMENYYAKYYSKEELRSLLKKFGFEFEGEHDVKMRRNPTSYYYSVFVKS